MVGGEDAWQNWLFASLHAITSGSMVGGEDALQNLLFAC
jgi:hypothetical protein